MVKKIILIFQKINTHSQATKFRNYDISNGKWNSMLSVQLVIWGNLNIMIREGELQAVL